MNNNDRPVTFADLENLKQWVLAQIQASKVASLQPSTSPGTWEEQQQQQYAKTVSDDKNVRKRSLLRELRLRREEVQRLVMLIETYKPLQFRQSGEMFAPLLESDSPEAIQARQMVNKLQGELATAQNSVASFEQHLANQGIDYAREA